MRMVDEESLRRSERARVNLEHRLTQLNDENRHLRQQLAEAKKKPTARDRAKVRELLDLVLAIIDVNHSAWDQDVYMRLINTPEAQAASEVRNMLQRYRDMKDALSGFSEALLDARELG